jgi:hypothetical protein
MSAANGWAVLALQSVPAGDASSGVDLSAALMPERAGECRADWRAWLALGAAQLAVLRLLFAAQACRCAPRPWLCLAR